MESAENEKAVRDAVTRFYAAVDRLQEGDPAPMRTLWATEPNVSLLPPQGGILEGWERIGAYWESAAQLAAASRATVRASVGELIVRLHGDLAYSGAIENVRVTRAGGITHFTTRATHIYRWDGDTWRLLHRHTDAVAPS